VIWWWLAALAMLFVVPPALIFFLNKVWRPIQEIDAYAKDILEHGVALTGTLDCVPNLIRTCELSGTARLNVTRYGLALARLLPVEER
jgi:hypothetical protein